jgi:hypothetical protein
MSIQNVPGVAGSRSRLRLYAINFHSYGLVSLVDPVTNSLLTSIRYVAERPDSATAEQPFYFETALPNLDRNYRVDIQVDLLRAGGPLGYVWAFVTTTNNETEEITISSASREQR